MQREQPSEETLRRYLLGRLSEEQQTAIEEQFFVDTEAFELLESVEDELLQDYVAGDLPPEERRLLESRWGGQPRMQARLEFARQLRRQAQKSNVPVEQESGLFALLPRLVDWRFALAVCAVVTLVVLVVRWRAAGPVSQHVASAAKQTPALSPEAQPTFALVLTPGLSRAAGSGNTFRLPRDAKQIRITAEFSPKREYTRYSGELKTAAMASVWQGDAVDVHTHGTGLQALFSIPTDPISVPNDFIFTISGRTPSGTQEDVEDYSFRLR